MSQYVIRELTKEAFDKSTAIGHEINWYAEVKYLDGTTKYFVFDEPYLVKVSDFFDRTIDNPTVSIHLS